MRLWPVRLGKKGAIVGGIGESGKMGVCIRFLHQTAYVGGSFLYKVGCLAAKRAMNR